jgi:hypothetical protein
VGLGAASLGISLWAQDLFFAVLGALLIAVPLFVLRGRKERTRPGKRPPHRGYPYRPGIESRLSDGRITTRGYAAAHPQQFSHWAHGPHNVYGEEIDMADWENWRINYYGK